ncbi:MAG: SEC-C domain-containing protein, partial [Actinobacteria bacterium]|nr:SEC-C domain-containing protein [Actinomycetota bacterium]
VEPVEPGSAGAGDLGGALARAFAARPEPVAFLTEVLKTALDEEPGLLAGRPAPMGHVLDQAGLEYYEGLVGPPGTDWAGLQAAQDRQDRMAHLAVTFGLSRAGLEALNLLVGALDQPEAGAGEELPAVEDAGAAEAAAALASEDGVAPAFLMAVDRLTDSGPDRVERLAGRWLRAARGRQRGPALWVQASCAELRGDQDRQEQLLAEAIAAHPSYRPALQDSAWYASDRGQPGRAAALLATAGVAADDPWRRALELFSRPGPNQGPRNEPCKCGSGRKAKSCCLAANGWPIEARLPWLYDKALSFLHRPPQRAAVAEAMGGFPEDSFLQDLALFEGGVLPRFLEARGPLLPSDERELVESWVGVRRRLCEVTDLRLDEALVLEDLLDGETFEVREKAATHHLIRHRLVFVRVLPDGRGNLQLVGDVMLVPFRRHQSLVELLA